MVYDIQVNVMAAEAVELAEVQASIIPKNPNWNSYAVSGNHPTDRRTELWAKTVAGLVGVQIAVVRLDFSIVERSLRFLVSADVTTIHPDQRVG